jgi:fatty-acyl-CoA synthase
MHGLMSDAPLSLTHVFERAERLFPDKEIVTAGPEGRQRTTYGAWAERTRRLAAAFDALGLADDARVGTFAWNSARHLELYFAAPCSGRVLHALNIRLFPDQVVYAVNHADDEAIVVDRSLLPVFWPLAERLERVRHIVVMDDLAGVPDAPPVPEDPRILDYEALLAHAAPGDLRVHEDERRAAAMCFTSGTTGDPKGVVYSHRSVVLHALATLAADTMAISERDRIMPVVPMFHVNAWGIPHAAPLAGASLVMPGRDLSAPALAALIEEERVTFTAGVPTIWNAVLPELAGRDLSALRLVVGGGSAIPRSLSEAYREQLGLSITQAWGMTETSPIGTVARIKSTLGEQHDPALAGLRATAGLPVALVDLRIVEPETGEVQPWDGEARGELQVRGPWIAASYYDDERGAEAFTGDGWLRTGDVATVDPEGYVRLVDRTKDLIKSGGEWISSVELENAIMAHPEVVEAAVVGVLDERWGERPLACVVRAEGSALDGDGVRAHLEGRVARWWVPERVEFVDEVPKTSVGKFSKKDLRARFAGTA